MYMYKRFETIPAANTKVIDCANAQADRLLLAFAYAVLVTRLLD